MEDPRIFCLSEFIKANKVYFGYSLFFAVYFYSTYIGSLIALNYYQGYDVVIPMCIGYTLYFFIKIPVSINLSTRTNQLNKFLNINDMKQYGKFQFWSNIFLSAFVVYGLISTLWVGMTTYEIEYGSLFFQALRRYYNPFSPEFNIFVFDILDTINAFFYVMISNVIVFFLLLALFFVAIIMKIQNYFYLGRIYARFAAKENQIIILKAFKEIHYYILLFFIAFVVFFFSDTSEYRQVVHTHFPFTSIMGCIIFFTIIFIKLIKISSMMQKIDLNFDLDSSITPRLFNFDKKVNFDRNTIFFIPEFLKSNIDESKGMPPVISVLLISAGVASMVFGLATLFTFIIDFQESSFLFYALSFPIIIIFVSSSLLVIGLMKGGRFFRIQRTENEIIFQKGFEKDHIDLELIEQIALNYKIKIISESLIKVRISIVLIIPEHQICIDKDINMSYSKNDKETFESQLIKVLTKTLFILGYTPKR